MNLPNKGESRSLLDLSLFLCKMGFRCACFIGFLECGYLSKRLPLFPKIFTPLEPVTV